jgi:hypothetical protein
MRETFAGYPENEIRALLGESALDAYGFDPEVIRPLAEEVGFTVDELVGPGEEAA